MICEQKTKAVQDRAYYKNTGEDPAQVHLGSLCWLLWATRVLNPLSFTSSFGDPFPRSTLTTLGGSNVKLFMGVTELTV